MKKRKILSVLLATAVAGSMVSVTAGCNAGKELNPTTVYFAGDSTVCAFSDNYYMPRYGYGTQFANYVSDKVTVKNLAYSGTSSYSYTQTQQYTVLQQEIKAGDYLIISFGHNDEASNGDTAEKLTERYTNANLAADDQTLLGTRKVSFKYNLYENYIKLAQEKGATPVLCTPIVRLTNKQGGYTGAKVHDTPDLTVDDVTYAGGDYAKAIRELATEKNVTCIDMTTITLADYHPHGENKYDEVKYRHAVQDAAYADSTGTVITLKGIDNTHTNKFGASMNAYFLATELKASGNSLGKYVKSGISKPTFNADEAVNPGFMVSRPGTFNPSAVWTTVNTPWYGTAYGATGTTKFSENFIVEQNPSDAGNNVFKVGGLSSSKGKISKNADGFAAAFRQIGKNTSFEITAQVTLDVYTGATQTGFGIMIRDDIAIDAQLADSDSIKSDYVAAGAYVSEQSGTGINFIRDGKTSEEDEYGLSSYGQVNGVTGGELAQGSTHTLKLKWINTTITAEFDGVKTEFTGLDLMKIDSSYMYLCLFATRGTVVTFNVTDFKIDGATQL